MADIEPDNVKDRLANIDAGDGCISWLVAYGHNYLLLEPPRAFSDHSGSYPQDLK